MGFVWTNFVHASGGDSLHHFRIAWTILLLALAFLACGGHHILLRLLSLHLCNEYLSLPKKKKKKKKKKVQ